MYPNPRFPHTCKVYRESGGDAFEESSYELLYEGVCRNYITTRNIGDSKVQSSQYTLAIPPKEETTNEEGIDVTISISGTEQTLTKDEKYISLKNGDLFYFNGVLYKRIIVSSFAGDKVSCIDARGVEQVGTVVDCYAGTMGNNVYWNYDAN